MKTRLLYLQETITKRLMWAIIGLAAILLLNLIISPQFFQIGVQADGRVYGNLISILNNGARVCILAVGMTLVYATGNIDLSVGSIMAVAGATAALLIRPGYLQGMPVADPQPSMIIIIALPLLVCVVLGLINGVLVAVFKIQAIIVTLITMYSVRGLAVLMMEGQTPTYDGVPFTRLASSFFLGIPTPVWIAFFAFVFVLLLTKTTAMRLFIESSGENKTASYYVGIRVRMVIIATYIFCAVLAGIAGLIHVASESSTNPNSTGFMSELDAIASVIIGGTMWGGRFTLLGSITGALIIQSLTTTVYFQGWPKEYALVFKAIVIIVVAIIQSEVFREKVNMLVKKNIHAKRSSD